MGAINKKIITFINDINNGKKELLSSMKIKWDRIVNISFIGSVYGWI
jgi:hypothetical protein